VFWRGQDVLTMGDRDLRGIRGGEISMIFQEPMTALNPVLPVYTQIEENLKAHTALDRAGRAGRARDLMDLVGIPDAARRLREYPHQFSGGMRQRVMIAMALICRPRLLIADEPTTALDVTVQAQILDLMRRLQAEMGMSILFITHDMGVVAEIAEAVAVMYAGAIVESSPVHELFDAPGHPYTQGLLASIPRPDRLPGSRIRPIQGTVPSLAAMPPGCTFAPRCQLADAICARPVALSQVAPRHQVACWHHPAVAEAAHA
jgi:peptide/nickel transport system ATP-binding protein